MAEDEMVGWHHLLNGHVFEQTLGDGEFEGQGTLASIGLQRVRHNLAPEEQQGARTSAYKFWGTNTISSSLTDPDVLTSISVLFPLLLGTDGAFF